MLFNKLIRTDLIFILAIISLFFVPGGTWKDGILGFATALFLISMSNHFTHYKNYKKFY